MQVDETAVQETVSQLVDCLLRDSPGVSNPCSLIPPTADWAVYVLHVYPSQGDCVFMAKMLLVKEICASNKPNAAFMLLLLAALNVFIAQVQIRRFLRCHLYTMCQCALQSTKQPEAFCRCIQCTSAGVL